MLRRSHKNRRQHGGVLITTLLIAVIIAIIMAGIGILSVSYYSGAMTASNYAASINLADAGVNYELRKLTQNSSTADQFPGVTYNFGGGTFKVYCTNRDGTTPWISPNPLYVYSVGTINGISRTVRAAAKNVNTVNFNLASVSGNLGTTHTFTSDGATKYTIVATGYVASNASPASGTWTTGTLNTANLYGKVTAGNPGETGMGFVNCLDHEIAGNYFIQLDMSNLVAGNMKSISLPISSIQLGEGFYLWGSNTLGTPGVMIKTAANTTGANGADVVTFTVPNFPQYKYFSISNMGTGDVLMQSNLSSNISSSAIYGLDQEWKEINGM